MKTLTAFCLLVLTGMLAGCESDSARSPIVIDPDNIQMRRGQEQVFTASGGYDYEWSIENREMGTLTRTPEDHRVTYTAISAPAEGTAVQVLRVVSSIAGASQSHAATSGTNQQNSTTHRVQTEAYIVHLADPEAEPPGEVPALTIAPTSTIMGTNDLTRTFSVSGGRPEYTWRISDDSLGKLSFSGNLATYTRGPDPGSLFIIARDASGTQVQAPIQQTGTIPSDDD